MTRNDRTTASRRKFLKSAGVAGLAAGIGGIGSAQDDQEPEETFVLVGVADAWQGQEPASIEGEANPTLELEAGKNYRINWENGDGLSHNVAIYSENGNLLVHSPFLHEEGATQTVDFTATEGMIDYYCEVHYISMRGTVEVSGTSDREEGPVEAGYFDEGPTVGLQTVADGLSFPTAMATADEEADRRFIADQPGQVYVHDESGLRDEPFLDVQERLFHEQPLHPETGLLGLAFHPDFRNNRRFYTRESRPKLEGTPESYHHTEVVTEYRTNGDLTRADPDSETFILKLPSPQSNHNTGDVAFGPDGLLYVPIGDGGFGGDTQDMLGHAKYGNGQDVTENLLGSILRIDVDGQATVRGEQKPYSIPQDNPLVGGEGLDEHYAWGFRNPYGMSFDSQGRLFAADAGRTLYEEVSLVEKGSNYGWNIREGTHCFNPENQAAPPDACATENHRGEPLRPPIIEYPHVYRNKPVGQSAIGGYIYEDDALPDLQGKYVFGDWGYSPVVGHAALLVATEPDGDQGETDGTATAGTGTAENETNATETTGERNTTTTQTNGTQTGTQDANLWSVAQLHVAGNEATRLNFLIGSFGRGKDGELYVLTSDTFRRDKKDGAVHKIVPPEQGNPERQTTADGTETTTD